MVNRVRTPFLLASFLFLITVPGLSQEVNSETIEQRIEAYKNDVRGPYKDLRWFCSDGTFVLPSERCPQPGGKQRARYKDEVISLQKANHLFLGQILTTTNYEEFWDAGNNHSRLKQYQMEKYLRGIDNGWILRKAQFYRGAIQAENEEEWGINFFHWVLEYDDVVRRNFFLIRQALKDIPHRGDDNQAQLMRSQSQTIAELYPPFMDLRIKIHGQPQERDIVSVQSFKAQHRDKLSPDLLSSMDELIETMHRFFQPVNMNNLNNRVSILTPGVLKDTLIRFFELQSTELTQEEKIASASSVIFEIRRNFLHEKTSAGRLALLDISNTLEELIYREAVDWNPTTLKSLMDKIYSLSAASAGTGHIERWEWGQISDELVPLANQQVSLAQLNRYMNLSRSLVEWGAGTVKANYQDVISKFSAFEPLAYGFLDDRIRSSVLLPLGNSVGKLGDFIANESGYRNSVMGISNQGRIRGLNPGYALGELLVVSGNAEQVEVAGDKIYIFERPPSDLKPVAGIATVSEGSLVSHVQLLARNLGIPNAVISDANMLELKRYAGERVFYAVSNQGTVIMKPESEMTSEERGLFSVQQRREDKIEIPVDRIRLEESSILNLRDIRAGDSGELAGPKAANLGQLKHIFPENVVEGLVIPFGIFRAHMDQEIPGKSMSYWQFLNSLFEQGEQLREKGTPDSEVEHYLLEQLEILRNEIKSMKLMPSFVNELKSAFNTVLGEPLGEIPVFLRSDTNMEDLKEFTGAGLNLTLFNVLDSGRILQGIKDVWASPYSERSYKWRQKYLRNPENVYPSILIIPSVDVDYSGVLITKGITSGNPEDLTIAFSRGAGGAVDGQVAESYLIEPSGKRFLIAPSREPFYNRLPFSGGTIREVASFDESILNEQNIRDIISLAEEVKEVFPASTDMNGPYDVELGFKDNKLWLFQVRPFVENKKAVSSEYLESIAPQLDGDRMIEILHELL